METENPYQAPDAALQDSAHPRLPTATSGWRLVNLIIDWLGLYGLAFVVGAFAFLLNLGEALMQTNEYLFGALLILAYYTPQEALFGRPLGKLVSGTRVVDENDADIGWRLALKRTLFRLVPFEAFSFLSGSRPRGWHDAWSGTRVVSLREKPAADAQTQANPPD